jgi:SHS2 domain-containing protein
MAAIGNDGRGYETFEHTADLGLLVRGRDLRDLFELAALGLCRIMFGRATAGTAERTVAQEGEEPEELLVAWLEEIIFAFEVEGFLTARAVVDDLGPGSVSGRLVGSVPPPGTARLGHSVKAVTYHDLEIRAADGLLEARVVLDV